jgi:hypothetical protein
MPGSKAASARGMFLTVNRTITIHSQADQLGSDSPKKRASRNFPRITDGERLTMVTAFRAVCSILAGVPLALVLVIAVELGSAVVHPVPPDFTGTMEEMCKHVERYPQWVLALAVAAWGGTTFASTWVTSRMGGRGCGAFVGFILLAAVVFNVAKLPYPMWFKVVNLIAIPVAIYLGLRSPSRRKSTAVSSAT